MDATKKFSKSQMTEFREAFRLFDKDEDGSITKEELGRVMRSLGQFASQDELQELLEEIDIDGDGSFSFDEFVEIVSNMDKFSMTSPEDEERELREAFKIFDKHGRGYISASDLRFVLHCLGEDLTEEEIEDMIREVDLNGDGRIDYHEFVRALVEPAATNEDEDEDQDQDDDDAEEGVYEGEDDLDGDDNDAVAEEDDEEDRDDVSEDEVYPDDDGNYGSEPNDDNEICEDDGKSAIMTTTTTADRVDNDKIRRRPRPI